MRIVYTLYERRHIIRESGTTLNGSGDRKSISNPLIINSNKVTS